MEGLVQETTELKISARNRFRGVVESLETGDIMARVKVRAQEPPLITAVISKEAVEDLGMRPGDKVEVIVKATSVMIAKE